MASIIPIIQHDGSQRWRATVRVKKGGVIVLNRTKTFSTKRLASEWAHSLEAQIEKDGTPDVVLSAISRSKDTLATLIERYRAEATRAKPIGKTKHYILKVWSESSLAEKPINKLTGVDIVEFCRHRNREHGSGPSSIAQYVGYIRQVLAMAKPLWGIDVSPTIIDEVVPAMKQVGLIGVGMERNRRLEAGEYERLLAWFKNYDKARSRGTPFAAVFEFAVVSAMRLGEICKIRWQDVDIEKRTVLIRDRKDPKKKQGNNQQVPLLGNAWKIVQAQVRVPGEDRIFPANVTTISMTFARACETLGIEDLTFHDLRHEATSRLFEQNYDVPQVAVVTGHKKWDQLRRYTKLRPESLHRDRSEESD